MRRSKDLTLIGIVNTMRKDCPETIKEPKDCPRQLHEDPDYPCVNCWCQEIIKEGLTSVTSMEDYNRMSNFRYNRND